MATRKKLLKSEKIKINGRDYLLEVYSVQSRSSSVRIRINKIIVNLSRYLSRREQMEHSVKFMAWVKKKLNQIDDGELIVPVYKNRSRICTHNKCYEINVFLEERTKSKSILDENLVINLHLSKNLKAEDLSSKIQDLSEKIIMADQQPYLESVFEELNQLHFQESFNNVRFRRTKSRFGSCSFKRNINISYRMLFAPREVFKYVCIHELAHLKEFNHSKKFWALVSEAMPEYKKHEKWLKTNGFMLG